MIQRRLPRIVNLQQRLPNVIEEGLDVTRKSQPQKPRVYTTLTIVLNDEMKRASGKEYTSPDVLKDKSKYLMNVAKKARQSAQQRNSLVENA